MGSYGRPWMEQRLLIHPSVDTTTNTASLHQRVSKYTPHYPYMYLKPQIRRMYL